MISEKFSSIYSWLQLNWKAEKDSGKKIDILYRKKQNKGREIIPSRACETKQSSFSRHGLHINTAAHSTGMLITVARCVFCPCNIWTVCLSYTEPDMDSVKSRGVYLSAKVCVHARVSGDPIRVYLWLCVTGRNISPGWGGGGGGWWMPPSLLEYQSEMGPDSGMGHFNLPTWVKEGLKVAWWL